jgi:hypothetical protein
LLAAGVAEARKVLEYRPVNIRRPRKEAMSLLAVYLVLMIIGDLVAYSIGLVIERNAPAASLPAFLAMYFVFLWVAWIIAVRITRPSAQPR